MTDEELTVIPEDNNNHDLHAVGVMKDGEVVGHVPLRSQLTHEHVTRSSTTVTTI